MASAVDVHRAAHEAFNARDWDRVRELSTPGVEYTDVARSITVHGTDEFVAYLGEWTAGLSDARVEEAEYLDAGTHSVCRFRGRGTNDGPMGASEATGRSLDLAVCEVLRIEDGHVAGGELYYDAATMATQLGIVEAPAVG
jgi:ketosteroid isomerase-like protein